MSLILAESSLPFESPNRQRAQGITRRCYSRYRKASTIKATAGDGCRRLG
jgi:hypothetical protein